MHRQLVTEDVPAARGLDGIEIADNVGDGDVRRRQLLDVTLIGIEPRDRCIVSGFVEKTFSVLGDRSERIVVDFTAGDDRQRWIEKSGERAQYSRFCLAAKSEQNEIVPAQKRVDDLRHHRLFVADHPIENGFTGSEASEEIRTKLVFDRLFSALGRAEGRTL